MTEWRSPEELLNIEDFRMCFDGRHGVIHAVRGVSLSVKAGEILALVGESGSGKTALCFSVLMLHAHNARHLSGHIWLQGKDVMVMGEKELEQIRGKVASMVFQDPLNSLDPVRTVGEQIITPMRIHGTVGITERGEILLKDGRLLKDGKFQKDGSHQKKGDPQREGGFHQKDYENRAAELLREMGMEQAEEYLDCYPHQLSGGQRQRVAIAVALACDPKLIIADEPTTALDSDTQKQIIDLLKNTARNRGTGILFVTHDLGLARGLASRIAVMKDGVILEEGTPEQIFEHPKEEYTKALVRYANYGKGGSHYHGECPGGAKGALGNRNLADQQINADNRTDDVDRNNADNPADHYAVQLKNVSMTFRPKWKRERRVLENFSMQVQPGEFLGLVGKSGCGKTTVAKLIMGLLKPSGGEIRWGKNFVSQVPGVGTPSKGRWNTRQLIFQDSASSFNHRMTLEEIIAEPLVIAGSRRREKMHAKVVEVMHQVHLDPELLTRHPYDISGGQRQRVAIARALITDPAFLIADEPLSSLDVPTQAEIVHLLRELHDRRDMTMILISHDLPMVEHVCDRILEMEENHR